MHLDTTLNLIKSGHFEGQLRITLSQPRSKRLHSWNVFSLGRLFLALEVVVVAPQLLVLRTA